MLGAAAAASCSEPEPPPPPIVERAPARQAWGPGWTPRLPERRAEPAPSLLGRAPGVDRGEVLAPLARAIERATDGGRAVSVVAWGASHTACDHWTGALREALQERYGDGGRGFTFPVWPNDHSYWQFGATVDQGTGWTRFRLGKDRSVPDHYGIAGIYFSSEGRAAHARVAIEHADRVTLHHRVAPGAGRYAVWVDGEERTTVDTAGPSVDSGSVEVALGDAGPHEVELRAEAGAPVVLYGLDFRAGTGGVVVHNLGLAGSRARYHHKWLDPVHSTQMAAVQPDLLVFAYGGNEANDFGEPMSRFAGQFERAIARAQELAPDAACLVMGPPDKPVERVGGWEPRGRSLAIARIEERVAERRGCAYFDTLAFMGGPLSMVDWVQASPKMARDDYVHFTARGYARLGEALVAGLDEAGALPRPSVSSRPSR
ncbi:MAG: hypothetical protein CMN30_25820 [Sandaracinus sp.]|nr:hypothetical protein [Sandaracinus sp.]